MNIKERLADNENELKTKISFERQQDIWSENKELRQLQSIALPFELNPKASYFMCPFCDGGKDEEYSFQPYTTECGEVHEPTNGTQTGYCQRKKACGRGYSVLDWLGENFKGGAMPTIHKSKPNKANAIIPQSEMVKTYNLRKYLKSIGPEPPIRSNLFKWILKTCKKTVNIMHAKNVFKAYHVGDGDFWETSGDYNTDPARIGTLFPYINAANEITRIQRIEYNGCNRDKSNTGHIHHKLNKPHKVDSNRLKPMCIFGEHLIKKFKGYHFVLCEGEKLALSISICFRIKCEKVVGLATGGAGRNIFEKGYLEPLRGCVVCYYPDSDKVEEKRKEYTSDKAKAVFKSLDITFHFSDMQYTPEQIKNKDDYFDLLEAGNAFFDGLEYATDTNIC